MVESSQIQDLIAELSCIALILAGGESAATILSLVEETDFIGYDGGLCAVVTAARSLNINNELITLIGIADRLRQQRSPNSGLDENVSILDKLGGDKALFNISQSFPVQDGLVKINIEGEVTLADATTAGRIVRDKARLRGLLQTLEAVTLRIKNPTSEITADLAFAELNDAIEATKSGEQILAKTGISDYELIVDDISKVGRGEMTGMSVGIDGFDTHTGGAKGGDILVISALDKMCKSTVMLAIANYLVRIPKIPVAIISGEMSSTLIQKRRISMNSEKQLEFSKLMGAGRQKMNRAEMQIAREVWEEIYTDPLLIIDNQTTESEVAMSLERLIRSYGVIVVIIDYLQRFGSDESSISSFCRRMTQIPQRFNTRGVWQILVNQLNDEGRHAAAIAGEPSTNYSYMSKQANRDGTILTTLDVTLETFACACTDQTEKEIVTVKGLPKPITRPKWRYMPTSQYCPDCREMVRSQNPIRPGKWIIEKARNASGGRMIPFQFDGNFMMIEELLWGGGTRQAQLKAPDAETGEFFLK